IRSSCAGELRVQDLERDVQVQRLVARQVNGGGRATSQLAQQAEAQGLDARRGHQRLRSIDVDVGAGGAKQRQMRARLRIVDVVGEDLLPALRRGQDRPLRFVEVGQSPDRL